MKHTSPKNFTLIHKTIYFYRTNRSDGTAHVDTAVLIPNVTQYNEIELYEELCIQSTSVSIKINSIPVTISAVYCSSGRYIRQEDLQHFLNILGHSGGVDFNSKYFLRGCYSDKPRGKSFHSMITNKNFSFISSLTHRPTHTNKHPDIVFLFCTKATTPNKYKRKESQVIVRQ